ncbi:membrane protein [Knoellia flava TL1]|uniref:Membrane protein n=1 Tax=Knoellia flava TL1 TaxID=1385518 RepID=A0ABR4XF34_9MICO|nr:membrane protein [Knoellia flava TL1]
MVGGLYLVAAGSHVGLVSADPTVYEGFAEQGLLGFVRSGWADIVMAHPRAWIYLLALGEATLGALLLTGARASRAGWVGVLAFHALLLLFGWGFWLYAVPAGALLAWFARRDLPALTGGSGHGEGDGPEGPSPSVRHPEERVAAALRPGRSGRRP